MTVDELLEELTEWQELGYGDTPVLLMNPNTQEHQEANEVNPLGNTLTGQKPALEIR
jgi:hypothetical protein